MCVFNGVYWNDSLFHFHKISFHLLFSWWQRLWALQTDFKLFWVCDSIETRVRTAGRDGQYIRELLDGRLFDIAADLRSWRQDYFTTSWRHSKGKNKLKTYPVGLNNECDTQWRSNRKIIWLNAWWKVEDRKGKMENYCIILATFLQPDQLRLVFAIVRTSKPFTPFTYTSQQNFRLEQVHPISEMCSFIGSCKLDCKRNDDNTERKCLLNFWGISI